MLLTKSQRCHCSIVTTKYEIKLPSCIVCLFSFVCLDILLWICDLLCGAMEMSSFYPVLVHMCKCQIPYNVLWWWTSFIHSACLSAKVITHQILSHWTSVMPRYIIVRQSVIRCLAPKFFCLLQLDLRGSRFLLRHLTDPKTWITIDDNKNDDDIPKYACGNDRYPISLLVNS